MCVCMCVYVCVYIYIYTRIRMGKNNYEYGIYHFTT